MDSDLYQDTNALLKEGRVSRMGLWLERHVWGDYSPTATRITNLADRLPAFVGARVVKYLGTGNYFN